MRRSGFEVLACFVPPSAAAALGRAGLALRGELFVQTFKHGVGTVICTQTQNPTPGVFDHAPSLEHDLLHHCLHAPPLGRMAQWCVSRRWRLLYMPKIFNNCKRPTLPRLDGHTVSRPDHPIRTAMPATAACASPRSAVYRRRQPERTLL